MLEDDEAYCTSFVCNGLRFQFSGSLWKVSIFNPVQKRNKYHCNLQRQLAGQLRKIICIYYFSEEKFINRNLRSVKNRSVSVHDTN